MQKGENTVENAAPLLQEFTNSKHSLSVRTKTEYLHDVNLFLNHLRGKELPDVGYRDIESFLNSRDTSPSMVNRRLSALNSFFKFLVKKGLVNSNPVGLVERQKMKELKPKFLTEDELSQVKACCADLLQLLIVEIFYHTGIRLSELIYSNINDLNLKNPDDIELKVMGKGGRERFVPVSSKLLPLITDYIDWRSKRVDKGEIALFVTPTRGRRISQSWLSKTMEGLRDRSHISKFRAHVLRHTFATDAFEAGVRRESVQQILGHRKPSTTDIYIHINPDVKKDYKEHFENKQ